MSKPVKPVISEGKNILKNMIVTVLTTVIGATLVYFLGFNNKKSGLSKLEKEEVTYEAWKTYVAVENIYAKNGISLLRDVAKYGGFKAMFDENIKESERFQNSVKSIIALEGVDKDLVDVLQRRLDNEKQQIPIAAKSYASFDSLIQTGVDQNWSNKKLQDTAQAMLIDQGERSKGWIQRALADIEVLSKTLTERYDQPFSMDDFVIIQIYKHNKDPLSFLDDPIKQGNDSPAPTNGGVKASSANEMAEMTREYLIGKWNAGGDAIITFIADGKMSWLAKPGGEEALGTWKLTDDLLTMNVYNPKTKKSIVWEFNPGTILKNSFAMILTKSPYNAYTLTRL